MHALPGNTQNKRENENDTSSHYNLFNAEFALALDLGFHSYGHQRHVSGSKFDDESRAEQVDEHSDGIRYPAITSSFSEGIFAICSWLRFM